MKARKIMRRAAAIAAGALVVAAIATASVTDANQTADTAGGSSTTSTEWG
ncbi:MAG TPA: hypothetical protein H9902_10430 [Candidatus Stackebrandtia faecavium]|nr:hypothetical protein [Candidatus Stackebrandtia faecavium]